MNVELLYRKWLISTDPVSNISSSHTSLGGFDDFYKKRAKATDEIFEQCRILLPFQLETHIVSKHSITWKKATSCVAYVLHVNVQL